MKIDRLLQVNMAVLVTLGAVLLGLGRQSLILPVLALTATVGSLLLTDVLHWIRLHRLVANFAALGAAVYSLNDFLRSDNEHQLLAIAGLLIYLQIVLLFQEKSPRIYWQLIVLSLLQVVVAAALNLGFVSGLFLALYALTAISALTLFFLSRETARLALPPDRQADDATQLAGRRAGLRDTGTRPPGTVLLDGPPVAVFESGRAELAGPLLTWRIGRQVLAMSLTTVLFASVLFFAMPRQGDAVWLGPVRSFESKVGFSGRLRYNELGELIQTDEPVMRVALFDARTERPYRAVGDLYLRGTVLTAYRVENGVETWQPVLRGGRQRLKRLDSADTNENLVRQEIVLEPYDRQILFAVFPVFRTPDTPREVQLETGSVQLMRAVDASSLQPVPYRYELHTSAFRNGWQTRTTPYIANVSTGPGSSMPAREAEFLCEFDRSRCPRLARVAEEVVAARQLESDDRVALAVAVEDHFRRSGKYTYTLDFRNVPRDRSLDPLEDFVANHRTGHCEYFAGAMALMLRSQGVPARVVVGYKGGDFNSVGKYYQVKQKHAHAWVEAYLEPRHITLGLLGPGQTGQVGVWLRLDPTPVSDDPGNLTDETTWLKRADQWLDYAQLLWSDYVLGLNSQRQQASIFDPLMGRADGFSDGDYGFRAWREMIAAVERHSGLDQFIHSWLTLPVVLAVLVVCLMAVSIYRWTAAHPGSKFDPWVRLIGRVSQLVPFRWLRWGRLARVRRGVKHPTVRFYERLLVLLARQGVHPVVGQTQREFAELAAGQLPIPPGETAASAPMRIVEAFYRVRFGGAALDQQEVEAIEHALALLATALTKRRPVVGSVSPQ